MAFSSKNEMHIFQPRLMTNDQNFEMQFSVVTGADGNSLFAEGNFRSTNDYGGMVWKSVDTKTHPLFRPSPRYDYSGIVLEYDYHIEGDIPPIDNNRVGQIITVGTIDGKVHYVRVWNYVSGRPLQDWEAGAGIVFPSGRTPGSDTGISGHVIIDFDNLYAGWQEYEFVQTDEIEHPPQYDAEGNLIYPEWTEEVWEWVAINDTIRWNELHADGWALTSPSWEWYRIDPTQISYISWGFTSMSYVQGTEGLPLGGSNWFKVSFTNWHATGPTYLSTLPNEPYAPHLYRFADDYDDNYDLTPEWLLYQMYLLGFRDWINFYIGASHYYDKKAKLDENGNFIPTPGGYSRYKYEMIIDKVFNSGFERWYENYLYWAKELGFTNIVHSISMENVDCPDSWKQLAYDGTPGSTMWSPTPYLMSFTNPDVQAYYKSYASKLCQMSVAAGIKPIIQLGEPWWWWIERGENQPPCFYDQSTRDKHLADLGYEIPIFTSSHDDITGHEETLEWLQAQNGMFAHIIRDHIQETYPEALMTVLFFPPSVLDTDRVPPMMRIVNYPKEHWKAIDKKLNLDFFQIEDYDWVIGAQWDKNKLTYEFPMKEMSYQAHRTHYFAGFVLDWAEAMKNWVPYFIPEWMPESDYYRLMWDRVNMVTVEGVSRELITFIWASAQIRKNGWIPPKMEWKTIPVLLDQGGTFSPNKPLPIGRLQSNVSNNQLLDSLLDLNMLQLNREGNKLIYGSSLKLFNFDKSTDLFAYAWVQVPEYSTLALEDTNSSNIIYIYTDALYGNVLSEKPGNVRKIEFNSDEYTSVLVGFYIPAGLDYGFSENVRLYVVTTYGKPLLLNLENLLLSAEGSTAANNNNLTVINGNVETDLFAYTTIEVEPYTNITFYDTNATQRVYFYKTNLYGDIFALKEPNERSITFNIRDATSFIVAFYVASGVQDASWEGIVLDTGDAARLKGMALSGSGSLSVNGDNLTVTNNNTATDLFAYIKVFIPENTDVTFTDQSATHRVYFYKSILYGEMFALKEPGTRSVTFNVGTATSFLLSFYVPSGVETANWTGVQLSV